MSEAHDGSRHGEYKVPGGKLVVVDLQVKDGELDSVEISFLNRTTRSEKTTRP